MRLVSNKDSTKLGDICLPDMRRASLFSPDSDKLMFKEQSPLLVRRENPTHTKLPEELAGCVQELLLLKRCFQAFDAFSGN